MSLSKPVHLSLTKKGFMGSRLFTVRNILSGLVIVVGLFLVSSLPATAKIGVGVSTGRIEIEKKLRAGTTYELPPLTVINTGDEPTSYEVNVTYHEKQPEKKPAAEWFEFEPKSFQLEPNQSQVVQMRLKLPLQLEPGRYFAYLEGHPVVVMDGAKTGVGIAAAAKLYFTVEASSWFTAIFYRLKSLWQDYAPWPMIITALIAIAGITTILSHFLRFNVSLKKKNP